jgi:hypothetical protein
MIVIINEQTEKQKKDYIKIDKWDTWSADTTLSRIITPLLIQLKADKHGAPSVDNEDVPEHLRATEDDLKKFNSNGTVDSNWFNRYDYILDEIIWGMNEIATNKPGQSDFFDHSEVNNNDELMVQINTIKLDKDGLKKYEDRLQNSCLLFGKYFQSLWT